MEIHFFAPYRIFHAIPIFGGSRDAEEFGAQHLRSTQSTACGQYTFSTAAAEHLPEEKPTGKIPCRTCTRSGWKEVREAMTVNGK